MNKRVSVPSFFLSFQIERLLELESQVARLRSQNGELQRENKKLRGRLEEQEGAHLQVHQDSQEKQAELVQKLQAKVGRGSQVYSTCVCVCAVSEFVRGRVMKR